MKKYLIMIIMTCIVLCGCSKNDASTTEIVEQQESIATEGDAEPEMDTGENWEWTEEITVTDENSNIATVEIAVDSFISTFDNASVIDVREPDFDEEYQNQFCAEVLDSGSLCGTNFDVFFMDSTEVDTEIERKWMEEHGEYSHFRRKCIEFLADVDSACPESMDDEASVVFRKSDTEQNNRCSLLKEEALELAGSYVREMGLTYLLSNDVSPLIWENRDSGDCVCDGYCVTYAFIVDGAVINYEKSEWLYESLAYPYKDDTEETYAPNISLEVYVNDSGVFCIRYNNPLIIEKVQDAEDLLSVEEAKAVLEKGVEEHISDLHVTTENKRTLTLDTFMLRYYRIKTDTGYRYIPVYTLSKSDSYEADMQYKAFLAIDAVSGAYIDVLDTMY